MCARSPQQGRSTATTGWGEKGRWWARVGSNHRPTGYEPGALTAELQAPTPQCAEPAFGVQGSEFRVQRGTGGEFSVQGSEGDGAGQGPTANGQEQTANSQQPTVKSQEPRAKSQEPRAKSQRPTANGQEPTAKSQRPRANGQRPTANGQRPTANGQRPAIIAAIRPRAGRARAQRSPWGKSRARWDEVPGVARAAAGRGPPEAAAGGLGEGGGRKSRAALPNQIERD